MVLCGSRQVEPVFMTLVFSRSGTVKEIGVCPHDEYANPLSNYLIWSRAQFSATGGRVPPESTQRQTNGPRRIGILSGRRGVAAGRPCDPLPVRPGRRRISGTMYPERPASS